MTNPLGSSGVTAVLEKTTATIAADASLSDGVYLGGLRLFGIDLPTLTSAAITFLVSTDGGANFKPLRDATQTEFTITASTGGSYIYLDPAVFAAITHLKVQSGTTASPVNQGSDRIFTLMLRPV